MIKCDENNYANGIQTESKDMDMVAISDISIYRHS